jgi:putative ABC transport system substrate-binding protein
MAVRTFKARAEQTDRMRRVGVLMAHPEDDPEFQQYADTFREGLKRLGWIEGRNISFDFRWGALDDADIRSRSAKELVGLQPDLILTQNTPPTASMLQQTRSIPIIFVIVADPVGSRFVQSLSRPGGNATGFTIMEPTIAGRWVQFLKEIAPNVTHAALLFNPATAPYADVYIRPFKAAAASFSLEGRSFPRWAAYCLMEVTNATIFGLLRPTQTAFLKERNQQIFPYKHRLNTSSS